MGWERMGQPAGPATPSLAEVIAAYQRDAPLAEGLTIPASWYTDPRVVNLEQTTVFSSAWQVAGRIEQLQRPGHYVSGTTAAGEPIVLVRGHDNVLRGFFNVCRHHAPGAVTTPEGSANHLRCPYHGWTYSLEGELKGTPDFAGVCSFDRSANGLVPVEIGVWEKWVFARVASPGTLFLDDFIGSDLKDRFPSSGIGGLQWMERRSYSVDCNWKVFVDNYLDGGYHVPHLHKVTPQRPRLQHLHDRQRQALLPAVEPDGGQRRRHADRRGADGRSRAVLLACIRIS